MEDLNILKTKLKTRVANASEDSQQSQELETVEVEVPSEPENKKEEDLNILKTKLKTRVANASEDSQQSQELETVEVEVPVVAPSEIVNGAVEQDEGSENKPVDNQPQQPAIIKMEGKPVNSPAQTASENDDNNIFQEKVKTDANKLKKQIYSHDDKIKAFKAISKKLKKMQKMSDLEKVSLKREEKRDKEADPKDLSEGFRMPPKKQGLGLETVASRDDNSKSIKFEITGTKDRDDLAAFIGLTVSISGLKDNNALVDFVSAVRVVGFEKAVEYMNELDKDNKVELKLFKGENEIKEEEKLEAFKKATVPTNLINRGKTIEKNKKMMKDTYGFNCHTSIKENKAPTLVEKVFKKNKGYVHNENGQLVKTRINRTVNSDSGMIRG